MTHIVRVYRSGGAHQNVLTKECPAALFQARGNPRHPDASQDLPAGEDIAVRKLIVK
jgi:hypothetical protein